MIVVRKMVEQQLAFFTLIMTISTIILNLVVLSQVCDPNPTIICVCIFQVFLLSRII